MRRRSELGMEGGWGGVGLDLLGELSSTRRYGALDWIGHMLSYPRVGLVAAGYANAIALTYCSPAATRLDSSRAASILVAATHLLSALRSYLAHRAAA